MTPVAWTLLEKNLQRVRSRIEQACQRVARSEADVTLVAVTKYVDLPVISALYEMGVRDFGESRPQSLWERAPALPADARWHMIGHWQTNKVRRTLPFVTLIHSLDRWRLMEEVSAEAQRVGRVVEGLLEIKLVADEAKHGFSPDEIEGRLDSLIDFAGIRIRGLMAMAALEESSEDSQGVFRKLAELRNRWADRLAPGTLTILSMGMSRDFESAIEAGATHVRVGSDLFEGLADD